MISDDVRVLIRHLTKVRRIYPDNDRVSIIIWWGGCFLTQSPEKCFFTFSYTRATNRLKLQCKCSFHLPMEAISNRTTPKLHLANIRTKYYFTLSPIWWFAQFSSQIRLTNSMSIPKEPKFHWEQFSGESPPQCWYSHFNFTWLVPSTWFKQVISIMPLWGQVKTYTSLLLV